MNFKKMNEIIAKIRNFMTPNRTVLIVIVDILLLGFIGYLLWVIVAQSEGTNNWKTYTNEKYGFSFKYPLDWKIREKQGKDDDKSEFSDNKNIFSLKISGDQNEVLNSIYSTINIDINKIDSRVSKTDINNVVANGDQKITINGYDGTMHINDWANTNAITREVKVQKGDLLFQLSFKINFPGRNMNFAKKRANSIINNFKFTDKTLIHKSPSLTREFKKRQFDLNKDFVIESYHPEVINIQDDDLTSMNCNSFFARYAGYDNSRGISDYARSDDLDVKLRAYSEELNAVNIFLDKLISDKYIFTIENEYRSVKTCTTENGKIIIIDIEDEGYTPLSNSYFGVVDGDKVDRIIKFQKPNNLSDRFPYSCFMPLELTNSNNLYLNCNTGYEGVGNAFFTYKVNLNNYSAILIRQCRAKGNLPDAEMICQ